MKCKFCEEEAVFHVSTANFENAQRQNLGGPVCEACLVAQFLSLPNAHHFVYRLDAPHQPDGFNYDDGLIMAVRSVARYRHKTVEEFMARGERLAEWYGEPE